VKSRDLSAKIKTVFACGVCGYSSPKWLGRCPSCNNWNTMAEEAVRGRNRLVSAPQSISEVEGGEAARVSTGLGEFDRVLGGGMVPGACVLIGGDPGIGKSTLMLQALSALASKGKKVIYICGEESARQIRLRARRVGSSDGILVWSETCVERILPVIEEVKPDAVVMDSVQTLYSEALFSSPGSVGQVREASFRLISLAKELEIPLFLVGHVTKDGSIAGPRVLEHMVDTVLYFEGMSSNMHRVLRAVKNRYGSVMEIGVFEMKDAGLEEIANPSEVFLAERPEGATGSAVTATVEGTRPVLVEIQALASPAPYGTPRRTVVGIDQNKVALIAAVLEKKAGIALSNHDVFVKVAGGLKIDEPAADLSIAAALVSNFLEKPVDPKTVVFAEIGLAAEVRAVAQSSLRIKEAQRLGFKRCILPKGNCRGLAETTLTLVGVSSVMEAMEEFFR
jgi:DNA repair protein RadA/Sms